jgi:hypothetical protein
MGRDTTIGYTGCAFHASVSARTVSVAQANAEPSAAPSVSFDARLFDSVDAIGFGARVLRFDPLRSALIRRDSLWFAWHRSGERLAGALQ